MDKLYTVEEVASILNIHANTIRTWLKNGNLKGVKVGRYWRVKETQLQEFTKEQEGGTEEK